METTKTLPGANLPAFAFALDAEAAKLADLYSRIARARTIMEKCLGLTSNHCAITKASQALIREALALL